MNELNLYLLSVPICFICLIWAHWFRGYGATAGDIITNLIIALIPAANIVAVGIIFLVLLGEIIDRIDGTIIRGRKLKDKK
jgi:hypothetical protein